jgi:hypothetical protein
MEKAPTSAPYITDKRKKREVYVTGQDIKHPKTPSQIRSQTQTAQTQPSGGNNAQESLHSADRGNIVLVHPVDVIPRGEIDVAVNHPRL